MVNRKRSAEDIRNARLKSAHRRRDSGVLVLGHTDLAAMKVRHDMTRKKLLTEVGPRMVRLRDRIHISVQGFF